MGFPLALVFADKGLSVIIHDTNLESLDKIRNGIVPFMEKGAKPLLEECLEKGRLIVSSNRADVSRAKTIIVTIGTPVDEFHNPVLRVVKDCVDELMDYLSGDQLLVLRSTVYPGTTEWLYNYFKTRGKPMKVAFCPERVVQGSAIEEIQEIPQIVSGSTAKAEQEAADLFRVISRNLVFLSPMEAEFAKLMTNAYRYVQFAAANQFYMIAQSAGVDYGRVLEGMKENYPRARDIPRAGFAAGPCLFKDTMQLSAFSNNQFGLGHAAMLVNEGMALFVVEAMAQKYRLDQLVVGLLGMAFKADIDDNRASLSYKLKRLLAFRAKATLTTDPHVTTDTELLPLETVLDMADLFVLCVPHSAYRAVDFKGKPVVDIWGHLGQGTLI